MVQEKREINIKEVIKGVLSFIRSGHISANQGLLHRAFKRLRTFSLLRGLVFGESGFSEKLEGVFDCLLVSGIVCYEGLNGQKFAIRNDVLKEIRRDLPKYFTADEIVQLSFIAERLEEMIAVEE
ncbi:MAG: hypothetical protein WC242_03575 [Candidatus Paceibacterota bacterium]|jgi:hypothetical protein